MAIQDTFAANLRRYRKAAGLTQEQLGEKCGLHRTYIGGIEQTRLNPSMKKIGMIADALGVDPAMLFLEQSVATSCSTFGDNEYALVRWSGNNTEIRPLSVRYDDLTIQVLLDLIGHGYRGKKLMSAYEETNREIAEFLDSRSPQAKADVKSGRN